MNTKGCKNLVLSLLEDEAYCVRPQPAQINENLKTLIGL